MVCVGCNTPGGQKWRPTCTGSEVCQCGLFFYEVKTRQLFGYGGGWEISIALLLFLIHQ